MKPKSVSWKPCAELFYFDLEKLKVKSWKLEIVKLYSQNGIFIQGLIMGANVTAGQNDRITFSIEYNFFAIFSDFFVKIRCKIDFLLLINS